VRTIAGCLLLLNLSVSAKAADVDWKLYGGASVAGPSFCFYDAKTVTRIATSGYIRVWTKCLAQKDLDGVNMNDEVGKKIADNAADRIAAGYVPPIIVIGEMEFQQIPEIVGYEEIANVVSAIEPQSLIFEEMNCAERMMRNLSIRLNVNGQRALNKTPGEWDYVPPEGNGAMLLKLLCPRQ